MESKPGSILLLISAIINFILALGVLVFGFVLLLSDAPTNGETGVIFGVVVLIIAFIVLGVAGGFKLWASKLMKEEDTTHKGGVVALVVGFLSGGDLLSIVGGILGITAAGNKK